MGREMLRRYLIVNGTTTVLLYAAIYAAMGPALHMIGSVRDVFDGYVMQSPILGPLINKIILVACSL